MDSYSLKPRKAVLLSKAPELRAFRKSGTAPAPHIIGTKSRFACLDAYLSFINTKKQQQQ